MRRALQMLSYRSRTIQEIASDLHGKGFSTQTVDDVVGELEQKGLVGDASLARDMVAAGQRSHKSRSRIYTELRRRGIDRETTEAVLQSDFNGEEERKAAVHAMRKILPQTMSPPDDDDMRRAAKKLSRRGFSGSSIAYALDEVISGSGIAGEGTFLDTESKLS
jgi:regulatory protein